MKCKIKMSSEFKELLMTHGTIITTQKGMYFNLPYWFSVEDKDIFMYANGELPSDLIEATGWGKNKNNKEE